MDQKNLRAQVSGLSDTERLALLASATVQPFAEVFWETTEHDSEIAKILLNLFFRLQEEKQYEQLFELLRILHGAFRVRFRPELLVVQNEPTACAYFLDCFLKGFYEIIDDHVAGIG